MQVVAPAGARREKGHLLLVGNPNVGKSALFGALTGSYVTVSNYPGTTVEVTRGTMLLDGRKQAIIDTPGANSVLPATEDERVTRDMILQGGFRAVVAVGDAKNLERTVAMAIQLCEMEIPLVLCLNMMDEAASRGMSIDGRVISKELGVDVASTVATERRGLPELHAILDRPAVSTCKLRYPDGIEQALDGLLPLLPKAPVSARSLGLMVLSGDRSIVDWIAARVDRETKASIDRIRDELQAGSGEPLSYLVNRVRMQEAARIASLARTRSAEGAGRLRRVAARLDILSTHPLWGIPILAAVLYASYQFVGVLGADILVGLLEEGLFGGLINPAASGLAERFIPFEPVRAFLVGEYGLITMALTYSMALVFPIVGTFFIAFGVLEDSGYLPRLAVMVNRLFRRMGLNGKAILPMVLGLGCDTMATLTTRILETRKERLIVIILLALGIPCSAQLAVILAMIGSLSGVAMVIWLGVVISVLFLVGRLAAWILPGRSSDFVLELPPLRLPGIKNILIKTVARIEWYLKEAVPLFALGTVILFAFDRLNLLGALERVAAPVLNGLLGLPPETAQAFIIGFLRRDFGAAGLYEMARGGSLDPVQIVVAVVTITLFIPCIANLFMVVRERGLKTGLAIAAFILPFALLVGAVVNLVLRALPVNIF